MTAIPQAAVDALENFCVTPMAWQVAHTGMRGNEAARVDTQMEILIGAAEAAAPAITAAERQRILTEALDAAYEDRAGREVISVETLGRIIDAGKAVGQFS